MSELLLILGEPCHPFTSLGYRSYDDQDRTRRQAFLYTASVLVRAAWGLQGHVCQFSKLWL